MQPEYFFRCNNLPNIIKPNQKIALFLDYDGTLVPIQKDPSQCILPSGMKKQLQLLANSDLCYLSILSGRSLPDIRRMVGINRIYYGGNHGVDILGYGVRYTHPKALLTKPIISNIKRLLKKEIADIKGAWLEDKKFTLTLHFRSVKKEDTLFVKKAFYKTVNRYLEEKSLAVIKGKKVLELTPYMSWDKGSAALWILQQFKDKCLPVYVGDDQTDETAFHAFCEKGITIRVGKSEKTFANYYIKGYWEVLRLLKHIQEFMKNL